MPSLTIRTRYQGSVVVNHDGATVTSVLIHGTERTESYLGGAPVLMDHTADTPDGIIWPMTPDDIAAKAFEGGKIRLFADDLHTLEVVPEWFDLELETAAEAATCPPWQLAEDVSTSAGEVLGSTLLDLLMAHIVDCDGDEVI